MNLHRDSSYKIFSTKEFKTFDGCGVTAAEVRGFFVLKITNREGVEPEGTRRADHLEREGYGSTLFVPRVENRDSRREILVEGSAPKNRTRHTKKGEIPSVPLFYDIKIRSLACEQRGRTVMMGGSVSCASLFLRYTIPRDAASARIGITVGIPLIKIERICELDIDSYPFIYGYAKQLSSLKAVILPNLRRCYLYTKLWFLNNQNLIGVKKEGALLSSNPRLLKSQTIPTPIDLLAKIADLLLIGKGCPIKATVTSI